MDKGVAIGLALAAVAVIALSSRAHAAAGIFACPIDGQVFSSQAELIAHYQSVHPGIRVPIVIGWR